MNDELRAAEKIQQNESTLDVKYYENVLRILNVFHEKIQRVRLLIEMSVCIGNAPHLRSDQFFAFICGNLFISSVIIDLYAIFDRKNNSEIKKLQKLSTKLEQKITEDKLGEWFVRVSEYNEIRHKVFAHASTHRLVPFSVDYSTVLALLVDFECVTKSIERECMNAILANKGSVETVVSEMSVNHPVFQDLVKLINNLVFLTEDDRRV